MADETSQQHDEQREVHQRLWLPILIPVIIFLFSVLIIYGLSRIYLELNRVEVGDVTLATPLALGVSLAILGVAIYLASKPSVPVWQYALIGVAAALMLTGGSIAAAVIEDEEHEEVTNGQPTPPAAGTVAVELLDSFEITLDPDSMPAGSLTFDVTNAGATLHSFHVLQTDEAPDALQTEGGEVLLDQYNVITETDGTLDGGASASLPANMEEGPYVVICNVPGHYDSGMHAGFTVTPPAPDGGGGGGPPAGGGEGVDTSLTDFAIETSADSAPAGPVTFNVTNNGSFHNLTVIQTDLAPDALPTDSSGDADLSQLTVVGNTEDLNGGESEPLQVDLQAGPYVLICTVPTHYGLGMHAPFTAGPPP
jgi:uncharacterized cupredoxin-like copper-binding protein